MSKLALLSVSDKTGLLEFAKGLVNDCGYRLLSTGGTAKLLRDAGLPVTEVSDHTGFPEMMEGRVKTLHPKIHGGLLCRRDVEEHIEQAKSAGIDLIDLVVVNLYPFEATVAKPNVTLEEAIENIDIGGPSMLRSAAKNSQAVTVVCDPNDYSQVLEELRKGGTTASTRATLARKVFARTASYDAAISKYLEQQAQAEQDIPDMDALSGYPARWHVDAGPRMPLRYGENPHQKAAYYGKLSEMMEQLQGKELSYNNILDISAATWLIGEFENPTVAILKHTNPCGVGSDTNLLRAWEKAFATDRQAPFGGIIVVNQELPEDLARAISEIFCEVIIAPGFSSGALSVLGKKKNLRLIRAHAGPGAESLQEIRSAVGGYLVQDRDQKKVRVQDMQVVTKRAPTAAEWEALQFGWKVVKHVKSNAIVYAGADRTLGIGAGQMSRVDSSRIAVWKAGEAQLPLKGSIVASDAFFPFADGLKAAAEAGATAAIQPGGSVRDDEVIAEANARDMAMVFTGVRHFRH
jgi:phosphoribosylaminoimidazolecarboxamide formyltransferase/IMP cyclohydrolase